MKKIILSSLLIIIFSSTYIYASDRWLIWDLFDWIPSWPENWSLVSGEWRLNGKNIRDETITSYEIRDWEIKTDDLADGSVTTAKIADWTIQSQDLDPTINFGGKFVDGVNPTYAVYTGGYVGIGTESPRAMLDVKTGYYDPILMAGYNVSNWVTPGNSSIAIWSLSRALWDWAISIWRESEASGNNISTSFTYNISYLPISIWYQTKALNTSTIGIWNNATASWAFSIAIWSKAKALKNWSISIWWNSNSEGFASIAMWEFSRALWDWAISIWRESEASGNNTSTFTFYNLPYLPISIWYQAKALNKSTISIWNNTQAIGGYGSTAMWYYVQATGDYGSTALWYYTQANWNSSTALWYYTNATTMYSTIVWRFWQTASDDVFSVAYGNYWDQNTPWAWLKFQVKQNGDIKASWKIYSNNKEVATKDYVDSKCEWKTYSWFWCSECPAGQDGSTCKLPDKFIQGWWNVTCYYQNFSFSWIQCY